MIMTNILNYSTITILVFIVYLILCMIEWSLPPSSSIIEKIDILSSDEKIVGSFDYNPNIEYKIKRNQKILILFKVKRYRSTYVSVDRIVHEAFGPENFKEYHVFVTVRYVKKSDNILLTSLYDIPHTIKSGCGHKLYTVTTYKYQHNIVTQLFPISIKLPNVKFCVED